jgi:hypothetical protein
MKLIQCSNPLTSSKKAGTLRRERAGVAIALQGVVRRQKRGLPNALVRSSQHGFLMLEAALALMLALTAASLGFWSMHRAELATSAMGQADNLAQVANAGQTLIMENYDAYQAGLAVSRNGLTLADGDTSGSSRAPTLSNLRAMALGLTPGSDFGSYKTLDKAQYITTIQRVPAGCETSPNGRSCNITGLVCLDRPVQDYGAPSGETDGFGIGKILGQLGGDGGVSMPGTMPGGADTITGVGGAWSVPNPFAGNPVGIVCQRFGFGAAGFGNFLRVNDTRDPNFQNNITLGGDLVATNGSVGVGTGTGASGDCRLGEILVSGAFWSRSATCIKRAWVEGASGSVGVADATGAPRAVLQADGQILSLDASGNVKAGITYQGSESRVVADTLLTNAGSAGLRANGEVFGDQVVINSSATAGGACPTNNAMVWGTGSNSLALLKCVAQVWTSTGIATGTVGGACPVNGQLGESNTRESLVCVNNVWQTTSSRMGKFATAGFYLASDGQAVPKPACGSGGVPNLLEVPQNIDARTLSINFTFLDAGANWQIKIRDNAGNVRAGSTKVQTGCWYN